jgi:hypothetical protein
MLIKRLDYAKQTKNETVKEFHTRFEDLLQQIPGSHHPEYNYLVYLYINALLVQLGFLLDQKESRLKNNPRSLSYGYINRGKYLLAQGRTSLYSRNQG